MKGKKLSYREWKQRVYRRNTITAAVVGIIFFLVAATEFDMSLTGILAGVLITTGVGRLIGYISIDTNGESRYKEYKKDWEDQNG